MESFEVRDHRNKAMFRVDDEYLNGYAKLCGIYSTGVYNCLCRHANHLTQTSFPSIDNMADKLDVSRDSILKGLRNLEKWGIIKKEKARSDKTGKWLHNSYTLVDKKFWVPKPIESIQVVPTDTVHQVDISDSPSRPQRLDQVVPTDSKVTHRKVTHNKEAHTEALLPTWLSKELWNNWVEYRKELGKKLTPRSVKQQIVFLEENKSDYEVIIKNSIQNGWSGLFPIKSKKNITNRVTL